MSEAAGRNLAPFFAQALHGTVTLDYAVSSATTEQVANQEGYFWESGRRRLVERIKETEPHEEKAGVKKAAEEHTYRSVAVIERRGGFRHPVVVELKLADGTLERREWDGEARWMRFEVTRPSRLVSVEVDPDHILFLDANRVNNSLLLEPDPRPVDKILIHLLFWLQGVLSLTAVLG
jgi:hypothetical protein